MTEICVADLAEIESLLPSIGEADAATRIRSAYDAVLTAQDPATLTPDLGGHGTTTSFTEAILRRL